MDGALWFLKQCMLFERLTPEQAERLNRHALMRRFPRHALVYAPSQPGQSVLVVASGRVKIKDVTPDGKETILAFLDEGELFGELALLDGAPRGEYAEAVVDSQILLLPRDEMLALMAARPDVALSITKLIGLRRQRVQNRLCNVLFRSSRERILLILQELAESHGKRDGTRCTIRLPLSHQDLASLIGVTRETATVVLGHLQTEGLVQIRRQQITVLDYPRLVREGQRQVPCK